jgi:hypothetical protein
VFALESALIDLQDACTRLAETCGDVSKSLVESMVDGFATITAVLRSTVTEPIPDTAATSENSFKAPFDTSPRFAGIPITAPTSDRNTFRDEQPTPASTPDWRSTTNA